MSDRQFRVIMLSFCIIIIGLMIIVYLYNIFYTFEGVYNVTKVQRWSSKGLTFICFDNVTIKTDMNYETVIIPGKQYYIKWKRGIRFDTILEWREIK